MGNGGGASLRDAIRRPASGQPLLPPARDARTASGTIGSRDGGRALPHGSRRARRYVLAQAAETLHRLGYRGLRAKGVKGRHIEALVAEWRRQGLSDGTIENRLAHLRWLANKIGKPGIVRRDNASYGVGARCAP